ncbi:MAG: hypothetical protein ACYCZB_17910 [Acidiphilium sp.]
MASENSFEIAGHANEVRIAVFLTFHFRAARLRYLYEVIRALSEFPVGFMSIVVITNTIDDEEILRIRALERSTLEGAKELRILSFPDLDHPFDLTWSHKPALKEAFENADPPYTHFVYLEDDLRFTYANFCYYFRYTNKLAQHGLIPAFLRVEYNFAENDIFSSDIRSPIRIEGRQSVQMGPYSFMNSDFPYMGFFVMDRLQLSEYLTTRSFDRTRSEEVYGWWIAERSAMGLTWEAVPKGYASRYVIPVDVVSRRPSPSCYVHHLPNNYTNAEKKTDPPHGIVRLVETFY